MKPIIKILPEKLLVGKRLVTNLADNKTAELWKSFMPERKEIKNSRGHDLYAIQVYQESYNFKKFDVYAFFEKWATVEVEDFNTIPEGMEAFILKEGLYAVFVHKGRASDGEKTFRFIFETWLPDSEFLLDNRPHYEILGPKYIHDHPDSEEDICIPIRYKD